MHDKLLNHPELDLLLSDGYPQPSAYWVDVADRGDFDEEAAKPTYRLCRGRLDWLCLSHSVALDLKKTQDATYSKLQRTVADYRYMVQAAFYLEGLRQCGEPVDYFIFAFIEEQPPHGIRVVELDRAWLSLGERLWQRDIREYSDCIESGRLAGLPHTRRDAADAALGRARPDAIAAPTTHHNHLRERSHEQHTPRNRSRRGAAEERHQ